MLHTLGSTADIGKESLKCRERFGRTTFLIFSVARSYLLEQNLPARWLVIHRMENDVNIQIYSEMLLSESLWYN